MPRGPETQIYSIDDSDLSLMATAEITLGGMLRTRSSRLSGCRSSTAASATASAPRPAPRPGQRAACTACTSSPRSRCSPSHCPSESDATARLLLRAGRTPLRRPGHSLPRARHCHRRPGRAGLSQVRPRSLDARPRRAGEYGEVTSTSNCTDYQARRLSIRYRPTGEKGTHFVHTLNGTAVAISRAIIAILENYQQADGSIVVPPALRAFMGKERITAPA